MNTAVRFFRNGQIFAIFLGGAVAFSLIANLVVDEYFSVIIGLAFLLILPFLFRKSARRYLYIKLLVPAILFWISMICYTAAAVHFRNNALVMIASLAFFTGCFLFSLWRAFSSEDHRKKTISRHR